MLQLRDVWLLDADYTLDPIAIDCQIPKGILRILLLGIYEQLNALDVDKPPEEASQNLQKIFPEEIHRQNVFLQKYITDLIKYGLLEEIPEKINNTNYLLTDKSIEIFTKASIKQKEKEI